MSALFANRRVTHLRVDGHHLGAHMFQTKGLESAGNVSIETGIISIETGIVSGEIAESGSACDIEMLQGVLCECLLIKVINKILNKNNKRVLLNERALNLEKFNAFKVETLKENVKGHFNVEGLPPHEWGR